MSWCQIGIRPSATAILVQLLQVYNTMYHMTVQCYSTKTLTRNPWASCQIRKIAGCACAGNAGNVFPGTVGLRSRHASWHVRDARAVMHVGIANWRFPLKSVAGNTFPAFPVHAQPAILRIWWEAHCLILCCSEAPGPRHHAHNALWHPSLPGCWAVNIEPAPLSVLYCVRPPWSGD